MRCGDGERLTRTCGGVVRGLVLLGWAFGLAAGCAADDDGTGVRPDGAREVDGGVDVVPDGDGEAEEAPDGSPDADADVGLDSDADGDAAIEVDGDAAEEPRMLFQCEGLAGGICTMRADGSERRELRPTGRDPSPEPDGSVLFHTDAYHVNRLRTDDTVEDLGEGAFPEGTSGGGIVFQCTGLGGGICRMNADGSGREELRATGRAPVPAPDDAILFHGDDYRVRRRLADGTIEDLGDGAFPRPAPDGTIVFQCSGLGGGICRMNSDGSGREEVRAAGREPAEHASGLLGFHLDSYQIVVGEPGGSERNLDAGRSVAWTP